MSFREPSRIRDFLLYKRSRSLHRPVPFCHLRLFLYPKRNISEGDFSWLESLKPSVNKMKFSQLIGVTSTSGRRAKVCSKYCAALSPANPPPAMTTLVSSSQVASYSNVETDSSAVLAFASLVTALLSLHCYSFERRVSRLTPGANLVEIEPKEANKKYTHN